MKTNFFSRFKKSFSWHWHVFPLPKDVLILSVYEFIIYLLLFLFVLYLYSKIQVVPVKDDAIKFSNIHIGSAEQDMNYGLYIYYKKPMTFAYAKGNKHYGSCNVGVYGIKDSVNIYDEDRPVDSLYQIYKSFVNDYNDSLSIYHIKFTQHDNLIDYAVSFSEYPWKKECNEEKCAIFDSHKEKEGLILNYVGPHGGLTPKDITSGPLSRPAWYSPYDISQSYFDLNIDFDCQAVAGEIVIDFVGATEFSRMKPEPDEITYNSVVFRDWQKIQEIKSRGLKFYAKFVELENYQNARIFVLGAILSALFAILLTFVVLALYKITSKYRTIKPSTNADNNQTSDKIVSRPQQEGN